MTHSVRATWVAAAFVAGLGFSSAAMAQGSEHRDPIEPINRGNSNLIDSSSLDKYAFVRNLYLQRRAAIVQSGRDAAGVR